MAKATARKLFRNPRCSNGTVFPLAMPSRDCSAAMGPDGDRHARHAHRHGSPAAIGFAFTGAGILYTLGGYDKEAGRLFGSVVGGRVALVIVHLLN